MVLPFQLFDQGHDGVAPQAWIRRYHLKSALADFSTLQLREFGNIRFRGDNSAGSPSERFNLIARLSLTKEEDVPCFVNWYSHHSSCSHRSLPRRSPQNSGSKKRRSRIFKRRS